MSPPLNKPLSWLKPPLTPLESWREQQDNPPANTQRFSALKLLSTIDIQRFVNYLGSRWRTISHFWFTRQFTSESSKTQFLEQATKEMVRSLARLLCSLSDTFIVLTVIYGVLVRPHWAFTRHSASYLILCCRPGRSIRGRGSSARRPPH